MEKTIEAHITKDKQILDDPTISPQKRRHIQDELNQLEVYHDNHPEDHHDPTALELYCETNPDADECRIYEN